MSEIRIKELAPATGQMDKFEEFEFIVDVPSAEASMKISGKDLQERVAPKAHTHAISEVQGLQAELDKKFDKSGGVIKGDFSVEGNSYMRNLRLEEFLEVPEFRYNRVETVVGDSWSSAGAGVVEFVDTETCRLVIKLESGEISSLRENDLCMGIFKNYAVGNFTTPTVDSDDSFGNRTYAGFTTCFFRLTRCLNTSTCGEWEYELREGFDYHPQMAMNIVAFGNTTDKERQSSRYETRTYIRYLTGMNTWTISRENIAAQFGDLSNLAAHGLNMSGYSAYVKNIYLRGYISDITGDSWFDSATGNAQLFNRSTGCGISFKNGVLRIGRIDPTNPEQGTDLDSLLADVASSKELLDKMNSDALVSPVEKSYLRERLADIRAEYDELLTDADMYLTEAYLRGTPSALRKANSQLRIVMKKNATWDAYEQAYLLAVAALEKYTAPTPEYIGIDDDFEYIAAYYESRATLIAAIHRAAHDSDKSDLEYLRDNFKNSTTEIDGQSGVVLSGFVGVKDESDEKVVAGMAGCALQNTVDPKHGKLMFFAGADGIKNASTAATRIYEDGHVEMGTGVFSGYMRVPFKRLSEEGTDYSSTTGRYTVNRNFNLITESPFGSYHVWINLPTSADYIGSVINIYDSPVRTRSSANVIIATDDEGSGILCSLGADADSFSCNPIQRVECFGGLVQFIAVPSIHQNKCWWIVSYNTMLQFSKPFSI